MMTRRIIPPPPIAPPTEEMIAVPCCIHKIGVDLDTPVGAELVCLFCGRRLILRGRPGTAARHFEIKE
jgi:hypothetical protein